MSEVRFPSRGRRFLWIAGIALVLFTVFGFFIAPPIIKAQLEQRASAALGRTVTVGKVRVNPYAVSVTLEQLDVRLKEGNGSFLGWDRLYVNFDPLASLLGTWTFDAIELDGFHAAAVLQKNGSFNFDDIIRKLAAGTPSSPVKASPPPALHLGSVKVTGARLDFTDQSRPHSFSTTFGPVALAVTEFRTVGAQVAPYHFEAVTEAGEKFNWSGTLAANPFHSEGNLSVENINIPKYLAYYGDQVKAELLAGTFTFKGRYAINLTEGARVIKISGGALQLRSLKIADAPGGETAIDLPALDIAGIEADALAMKGTVETMAIDGGRLRVQRAQSGALNLRTMLEPSTPEGAAAQAANAAPPAKLPEFVVREVVVKDFAVAIADLAAPRPAQLALNAIQFSLKNVTLADGAVMPLALALNWAPQGTVKIEGSVTLKPELKAGLKTDVAALALLPLSPYLEQFLNARITQGAVSATGTAQVALAGGTPAISYEGTVTVDKFGLVDAARNEELAGFASLTLKELKAATAPKLAVSLAEIDLEAPYARVIVNADKSLNLAGIAKTAAAPAPIPAAAAAAAAVSAVAPAAPLPDVKVGKVIIAGGEFSLTDRSLEPNVRMELNQFAGTIAGLSSENLTRADINLAAMVDGVAPFTVAGKLDPFGATRFIDLEIDAKNVELLPLSPLIGKYAGYELARGKLNSSLKFRLAGRQMDATDVITLNGFAFGASVDSPDATKLPVRLGVALLKDTAGQIVIDVPVSGNIDDPDVRLGKAIVRVIVNLLTKAAVSPFSLLGSLIGGGGEELAFQEFAPGLSQLQPVEVKKLETVVRMLNSRPALGVAIEGGYDGPADTYALQRLKVADLVRRKIWEERHAGNPNIPPPDQLQTTPEEDLAMIRQLFDEKFPPGTEFGAPLPEKPAVVAASAPERRPGFLRRIVDTITLQDLRKKAPQATGLKKEYAEVKQVAADAGVPVEQMVGRLAQAMPVTDDDLRALAATRAARVRDYFLNEGKITADRIFLTQGSAKAKENKGPRVFLSPQ
ncbi:MAG: DUF748 domain-containing protein [Lacunisphaera sp.]